MKLRQIILLTLLGFLSEVSVAQTDDCHYVYFSDGSVEAYPLEYVKMFETTSGGYVLTLVNDSVCEWNVSEVDSVSSVAPAFPQLIEFDFNDNANEQLVNDVYGVITDEKVTATVAAIGKWLTPTYKLSDKDAVAYVDGVAQVSGVSRLRFADEVVYTLGYPKHQRFSMEKISDEVWSETDEVIESIVLTEDMLSTNAPSGRGEGLDNLIDDQPATFFHSTWSNDPLYEKLPENEYPYIAVALTRPISALKFYYQTRIDSNDRNPYAFRVYASNDNVMWNEVAYFDESAGIPTVGAGVEFTSPIIDVNEEYRYWKFEQTACAYKNYLVLSTFKLYEVTNTNGSPELLEPARYAYCMRPLGREVPVDVTWLTDKAASVPRIDIYVDGGQMVSSKDYYLNALITIDGNGVFADFEDSVQIKGRGNSSWSSNPFAKNPYRLKFASSVKPFGLKKGKNWNLIAQAQTGSMMSNPMAMKVARMVGTAGANDVVPVDLYMNGLYRGSYIFTQKTGLANNSIDLDDEAAAVFLELDTYYDETYRFYSNRYSLPVNIKEPDFSEGETVLDMAQVKTDFNRFETSVYNDSHFERLVDVDMLVRFMLVNELVFNTELGHPKSTFLYKENLNDLGSPYVFGPVWDFDWGYGYEGDRGYCTSSPEQNLFDYHPSGKGNRFFTKLWRSSALVKRKYYELWCDFMENHLQELIDYADDYFAYANNSFVENAYQWGDGWNYEYTVDNMKTWLEARAHYIFDNLTAYNLDAPMAPLYGDVNGNKVVASDDLDMLLSYMLDKKSLAFDFDQADMDVNGEITVSDVAWLCEGIDEQNSPMPSVAAGDWKDVNKALSVRVDGIPDGMEWQLAVSLDNAQPYIAFQMDVELPEGITVFDDFTDMVASERLAGTHVLRNGYLKDGSYRIVGYSTGNAPIAGTEGDLFTLLLTADRQLSVGSYPLTVTNMRFLTRAGFEEAPADVVASLNVKDTAIEMPTASSCTITYYTIEGEPLAAPRSGIVICRKVYGDGRIEVTKRMYK